MFHRVHQADDVLLRLRCLTLRGLLLRVLFRKVCADHAATDRSNDSVVPRVMHSEPAYHRALEAACGVCRAWPLRRPASLQPRRFLSGWSPSLLNTKRCPRAAPSVGPSSITAPARYCLPYMIGPASIDHSQYSVFRFIKAPHFDFAIRWSMACSLNVRCSFQSLPRLCLLKCRRLGECAFGVDSDCWCVAPGPGAVVRPVHIPLKLVASVQKRLRCVRTTGLLDYSHGFNAQLDVSTPFPLQEDAGLPSHV